VSISIGRKDYYLWSSKSSTSIPWERQYLNRDFYQSEIKRLLNTADWHSKFKKAEPKSILPNVQYYIIPHKHSRVFWVKKQILEKFPDYKILWLSAIHNSPQTPIFALVPGDLKLPNYYSMIEIENPVKIQFIHKKNNEVNPDLRLEMLKLVTGGNKRFEVLDLEVKRGGTSFTIDTVRELKKAYPEDEFYLVIGSDLLRRLPEWKDFEQLKKEVKIVVAHRENYPIDKSSDFILANITQIDVSSSQIRDLIKQGRSIRYLVKGSIKDYIEKHNLYK